MERRRMEGSHAVNLGLRIGGWVLAGMGAPFAVIGAGFLTVWADVPMEGEGDARILGAVFFGIGLLMLIIGLAMLWIGRVQRRRAARLMREGVCHDAEIVDAYYSSLQVNGRPGLIFECRYVDADGATHLVKSAPQWRMVLLRDPREYRAQVWVDPYDAKRYHVEVRSAAPADRPPDYDDR